MPVVGKDVRALILLYQRCRENKALPFPGGILDQPEEILSQFDIIDVTISQAKKERAERERDERSHSDAMRSFRV